MRTTMQAVSQPEFIQCSVVRRMQLMRFRKKMRCKGFEWTEPAGQIQWMLPILQAKLLLDPMSRSGQDFAQYKPTARRGGFLGRPSNWVSQRSLQVLDRARPKAVQDKLATFEGLAQCCVDCVSKPRENIEVVDTALLPRQLTRGVERNLNHTRAQCVADRHANA